MIKYIIAVIIGVAVYFVFRNTDCKTITSQYISLTERDDSTLVNTFVLIDRSKCNPEDLEEILYFTRENEFEVFSDQKDVVEHFPEVKDLSLVDDNLLACEDKLLLYNYDYFAKQLDKPLSGKWPYVNFYNGMFKGFFHADCASDLSGLDPRKHVVIVCNLQPGNYYPIPTLNFGVNKISSGELIAILIFTILRDELINDANVFTDVMLYVGVAIILLALCFWILGLERKYWFKYLLIKLTQLVIIVLIILSMFLFASYHKVIDIQLLIILTILLGEVMFWSGVITNIFSQNKRTR